MMSGSGTNRSRIPSRGVVFASADSMLEAARDPHPAGGATLTRGKGRRNESKAGCGPSTGLVEAPARAPAQGPENLV